MTTHNPDRIVARIAAALDAVDTQPVDLDGGPFDVPLNRAAALWLIPWICEPTCRFGARAHAPRKDHTRALYAAPRDTHDALHILRELGAALATTSDGTLEFLAVSTEEFQATAAGDDDGHDDDDSARDDTSTAESATRHAAGRFRLTGTVSDGTWHIARAWPHATTAELREAFAILDLVDGTASAWARDAAEAAAIAALAAKSAAFLRTDPAQRHANSLAVTGAGIVVQDDRRPYLAMVVVRLRLAAGRWDVRTAQEADEARASAYLRSIA